MKTSFDLIKSLNENALPKIKKTRVLSERENKLNEGAGAGYNITGTIDASTVNSFNVVETTEDKYGTPTYLLDCDISATLEDVTFESYYDGGHVDSAQIQITKLLLVDNHDPEEKGELNKDNIRESLDGTQVKSLIGGGWIHSTFDGNIEFKEENADGSVYSDFYVYGIEYHFIDEELVKFIDLAVQGETVIEEYIVYAEDYDELDRFDSEKEAIEYAKNTPNAVKVEQYSYRYDFGGDIDVNSEYSETVWEKDDFEESEHIKESSMEEVRKKSAEKGLLEPEAVDESEDSDKEKEIAKLEAEIKKKVEQYSRAQKRNNGDSAESDRLEGEIDSLELKLKKLKESDGKYIQFPTEKEKDEYIKDNNLSKEDYVDKGINAILLLKESEESIKYNIYLLLGGDGVYNSKLVDTVESLEQAQDRVAELEAENGCGAYYEKVDSNGKPLDESEELIDEQVVSDKLTEVKSQGNVYMLQDNDTFIVGEDYNKEENLIENAEIYNNKEEADKDYFSRCDITRDGEQVDPTEKNPEKEEITESEDLDYRDSKKDYCKVYYAKNTSGYTLLGLIVNDTDKKFQLVSGQKLITSGRTSKRSKKQIWDMAKDLANKGYEEVRGPSSVAGSTEEA